MRGAFEVAAAGLLVGFEAEGFNLLFEVAEAGDGLTLFGPAGTEGRSFFTQLGDFALDMLKALSGVGVVLALEGCPLDFERGCFSLQLIYFLGTLPI